MGWAAYPLVSAHATPKRRVGSSMVHPQLTPQGTWGRQLQQVSTEASRGLPALYGS